MPLNRLRRATLPRDIRAELSRAIVTGDLPAGAALSEPALAAKLGVSRAPIREALIELELRGMVEFDARGRTRVPTLTPADLREILDVRTAIDPLAAALAARHADKAVLERLEDNIKATAQAATLAEVSHLDTQFHAGIVQAAGNRRLLACWSVLESQVELWLTQMQVHREALNHDTRDRTVAGHRDLLDAVRSGDPARADAEARRHLDSWAGMLPTARTDGPTSRPPHGGT
jgi:DNA-binding GntR family transcriptional regulator